MADTGILLRIFEVVAILIPVTGILAQSIFRLHATELIEIDERSLNATLYGIILGGMMLVGAGLGVVNLLIIEVSEWQLRGVLLMLFVGLGSTFVAVFYVGKAVAEVLEREEEQQQLSRWRDNASKNDGE